MTIHHATTKRAAKLGFILTEEDRDGFPTALGHWAQGNVRFQDRNPKQVIEALSLARMLRTEYPALQLMQDTEGYWVVEVTANNGSLNRYETVPALPDVLDLAQQHQIDLDEDTEENPSEIVAVHYKEQYREKGNPNHCGDWLALTMDGKFRVMTDKGEVFDVDKFTNTLKINGVDMTGKWAGLPTSGQKGWVGRYRMNGRQKLEVMVAIRGDIRFQQVHDEVIIVPVPEDELEFLRTKHAKAVAKWAKEMDAMAAKLSQV